MAEIIQYYLKWNGRYGIFAEFTVWHFATTCSAVKFAKPLFSSHFYSKSKDPSYVGSAFVQNIPGKIGEASLAGYTHGKRPRDRASTKWSDCISGLAWSRLGVEAAELSEIAFDREVCSVLLGMLPPRPPRDAAPATLPRG